MEIISTEALVPKLYLTIHGWKTSRLNRRIASPLVLRVHLLAAPPWNCLDDTSIKCFVTVMNSFFLSSLIHSQSSAVNPWYMSPAELPWQRWTPVHPCRCSSESMLVYYHYLIGNQDIWCQPSDKRPHEEFYLQRYSRWCLHMSTSKWHNLAFTLAFFWRIYIIIPLGHLS